VGGGEGGCGSVLLFGGFLSIFAENVVARLHFDGLCGGGGEERGGQGGGEREWLFDITLYTLKDSFCTHTHTHFQFSPSFSPHELFQKLSLRLHLKHFF
jgi:hypothetical protein